MVVRSLKGLEFGQSLLAEVCPVHQEEHPGRLSVLDEPVGGANRGVGLSRTGRHLNESTGPVVAQRFLQVGDRLVLNVPQVAVIQRRHRLEALAQRRPVGPAKAQVLPDPQPAGKGLRSVEAEDLPARRFGVEQVGEPRFSPRRFVAKRER